jgi:ribonucleoside-diphosphate reductase alpha chain
MEVKMRPQRVPGATTIRKTGCGKVYATISEKGLEYQEVFFRLGKCGGCALSFLDGIGRLVSMGLNKPLTIDLVVRAFKGIRCPSPTHDGPIEVLSCLDAIAQLLEEENGLNSK